MINIIPSGYRFTFVSTEASGEHEASIIKEGVTLPMATLYAQICRNLHNTRLEGLYEPDDNALQKAYDVLFPIFKANSDLFNDTTLNAMKEDVGSIVDFINFDILGFPNQGFYMRVLENFKIEYIPEEIFIQDVTDSF